MKSIPKCNHQRAAALKRPVESTEVNPDTDYRSEVRKVGVDESVDNRLEGTTSWLG